MVQYNRCSSYAYSTGVFGCSNYACIFVCTQSFSAGIGMFHKCSSIWIFVLVYANRVTLLFNNNVPFIGFWFAKNLKTQRPSVLFTCFCLYVLCIDLLKGGKLENIDYSILVVLISFFS